MLGTVTVHFLDLFGNFHKFILILSADPTDHFNDNKIIKKRSTSYFKLVNLKPTTTQPPLVCTMRN